MMKKKILFPAIAATVLVLGLTACEEGELTITDVTSEAATEATEAATGVVAETIPAAESTEAADASTAEAAETTEEGTAHAGLQPSTESAGESTDKEAWMMDFEASLLENYGVVPAYYEALDDGTYQVYVDIDGEGTMVPYVVVDPQTGDYHG